MSMVMSGHSTTMPTSMVQAMKAQERENMYMRNDGLREFQNLDKANGIGDAASCLQGALSKKLSRWACSSGRSRVLLSSSSTLSLMCRASQ